MNDSIQNMPYTPFQVTNVWSLAVKLAWSRIGLYTALAVVCAILPPTLGYLLEALSPQSTNTFWPSLLELLLWAILYVCVIYLAAFDLNLYEKVAQKNIDDTQKEPKTTTWRLSYGVITYFFVVIVVSIGLGCMIVPGIYIACILAAAITAVVVEGLSPSDGFGRSGRLTVGHRMEISLIIITTAAAGVVIDKIFGRIAERPPVTTNELVLSIMSGIPTCLVHVFYATVALAIYYLLVLEKDPLEFEKVDEVFS